MPEKTMCKDCEQFEDMPMGGHLHNICNVAGHYERYTWRAITQLEPVGWFDIGEIETVKEDDSCPDYPVDFSAYEREEKLKDEITRLKAELEGWDERDAKQCRTIRELTDSGCALTDQLAACPTGPKRTDEPPHSDTNILACWEDSYPDIPVVVAWCDDEDNGYPPGYYNLQTMELLHETAPGWWAEIKEAN
jgi:hypothetical protein